MSAHAEWYVGGALGQARFDDASVSGTVMGYSTTQDLSLEDDKSTIASIFGGYQFNRYFALEGSVTGIDALDGSVVTVGDMSYIAIQPKVSLPVTDHVSLFAKAGVAYFNAEIKVSNAVAGYSGYSTFSDSDVTGILGLGVEVAATDNWHIRASWDYLRPELDVVNVGYANASIETDINVFSLGVSYHFN
ncbi:Outer membrane protein [Vibrio furnissii NCTC 11218]|nr:Outer membrane protein [Vibrio furnissii NCTC 11218]